MIEIKLTFLADVRIKSFNENRFQAVDALTYLSSLLLMLWGCIIILDVGEKCARFAVWLLKWIRILHLVLFVDAVQVNSIVMPVKIMCRYLDVV